MFDIAFAMTGEVRRNARALRQLSALAGAGYRLVVAGFDRERPPIPDGASFVGVERPQGTGPRFFFRVHARFRRALASLPARVYHASDLYVLRACRAAAGTRNARFTYDARELYPHVAATAGRPHVRWFWHRVEDSAIRDAAAVWTVSPGIAHRLTARYGIKEPIVQYNAPALRPVDPSHHLREATGWASDRRILLHAGQMRRDRGCESLVRAMTQAPDCSLAFLGYGPLRPALEALARELRLEDRVAFLDPVPVERLVAVCAGADAGVTLLADTCLNHRLALPNKFFDYLAAGLPVLSSALPELERMVSLYRVGLTADPRDTDALARGIQRILDPEVGRRENWSGAARRAAETFDWQSASDRFVEQMTRVAPPSNNT